MNVFNDGLFCLNDGQCWCGCRRWFHLDERRNHTRKPCSAACEQIGMLSLASGRNDQVAIIGNMGVICSEVQRPNELLFHGAFLTSGQGLFFSWASSSRKCCEASHLKAGIIRMAMFTDLLNVYKPFLLFFSHYLKQQKDDSFHSNGLEGYSIALANSNSSSLWLESTSSLGDYKRGPLVLPSFSSDYLSAGDADPTCSGRKIWKGRESVWSWQQHPSVVPLPSIRSPKMSTVGEEPRVQQLPADSSKDERLCISDRDAPHSLTCTLLC